MVAVVTSYDSGETTPTCDDSVLLGSAELAPGGASTFHAAVFFFDADEGKEISITEKSSKGYFVLGAIVLA